MIERVSGANSIGRSQSTRYKDLVWTVATATNEGLDLVGQTAETLHSIDVSLVWNEWIGSNPDNWPQRACLGVSLGGNWLIEVTVTAVSET